MFNRNITQIFILTFIISMLCACSSEEPLSCDQLLHKAKKHADKSWSKSKYFAQKATIQNPRNVNAKVMYALTLENTGDKKAALVELESAIKIHETHFMAQFTRGRILFSLKRFDDCIAPLKNAIKLRKGNVESLIMLAQATNELHNYDKSAQYYKMLIKNPKFHKKEVAWNELTIIFIKQNKLKNAVLCFRHIFSKYSRKARNNHSIILNYAVFWDRHIKKSSTAIKYYKKYLDLTDKNLELKSQREKIQHRIQKLSGRE